MASVDYDLVLDQEFDALNLEIKDCISDKQILAKNYPARAHARKVAAELRKSGAEGLEKAIIFLPGEPTREYENSDMGPSFRQRRYFFYLSGVNYADCAVTYDIAKDKLTLWIPFVDPRQALWTGSHPDAAQALRLYDADDVRYVEDLSRYLKVHSGHTLLVLNRQQTPHALSQFSEQDRPKVDATSLLPAMDRARVVKDAHEIALIRRANAISSAAHREIARNLLRLRNEREVEAIFLAACISRGARDQAYAPIAGAGPNASTLHYVDNNQPLEGRELMVVDAGCEVNCYASDITRTLPVTGSFSKEGGEIYSLVEKMQEECIAGVRPGKAFGELHLLAAKIAADGLLDLGILKGDRDAVHESRVVSAFFPHGLGHHIGLECHDVSGDQRLIYSKGKKPHANKREPIEAHELSALSMLQSPSPSAMWAAERQLLEPGMVVTVEPGIYFHRGYIEGYFLSQDKFRDFIDEEVLERYYKVGGVRIEDDLLVTRGGYENLTSAPKGDEMLDVINGGYQVV